MKDDIKPTGFSGGGNPAPAKIPPRPAQDEPAFVPPEEIASVEEMAEGDPVPETVPKTKPRRKLRLPQLSKKQWLIVAAVTALFLGAGAVYASRVFKKTPAAAPPAKVQPAPEPVKPTTVPSKLSGIEISPEVNQLPVTGVMIENSPDARPQAGLKDASIVYEAIAEGGITRFLTLFLDKHPTNIGPVRSVRPYYLDFLVPYDAAIAHAGGSGQALGEIRDFNIKDLDHGANGDSFRRSADRFAPHNLYTSFNQMLDLQRSKGFASEKTQPLLRKKEAPSPTPNARSIDANISAPLYNSHWDYDAPSNSYIRGMAGQPHNDDNGGNIAAKVIIMPVMTHSYAGIYSNYGVNSGGKVYIFQDGAVTEGAWSKSDRYNQFVFKDAAGNPIGLNPGQTWFTIVSSPDQVVFRP